MLNQTSVAAEHERLRDRVVFRSKVRREHIVGGQPYRVSDSIVRYEFAYVVRRRAAAIVDVHSDDFEASPTVLASQTRELRSFQSARRAPRRPKIHHHNFAAVIR